MNENRVTALVDCTSTDHPLHMCKVSRLYLQYFSSNGLKKYSTKEYSIQKYPTKGNNLAINEYRVIALVDCTSTDHPLHTCEVSTVYLKYFRSYGPDKNLGRTDGLTDGRMDGHSLFQYSCHF